MWIPLKTTFKIKKLLFPSKQVYFRFPFLSSSIGFQSKNIVTLAFAIKYKGRKSTSRQTRTLTRPLVQTAHGLHTGIQVSPYKNFQSGREMWTYADNPILTRASKSGFQPSSLAITKYHRDLRIKERRHKINQVCGLCSRELNDPSLTWFSVWSGRLFTSCSECFFPTVCAFTQTLFLSGLMFRITSPCYFLKPKRYNSKFRKEPFLPRIYL